MALSPVNVPYTGSPDVTSGDVHGPRFEPTPSVSVGGADRNPAAFGTNVSEALGHLGEVTEGAGRELFDRAYALQELQAHANVSAKVAEVQNQQFDTVAQYQQTEGKNAVDGYASFQKGLNTVRSAGAAGLSPYETQLYDDQTRQATSRMNFQGADHAASEAKKYTIGAADAVVTSEIRGMTLDPTNTAANEASLAKITNEVNHQADVLGISPEQRKLKVDTAVDTALQQQIIALGKSDATAARALYDQNVKSGRLFTNDALKLDEQLKNLQAEQVGRTSATGATTGTPPPKGIEAPGTGGPITTQDGINSYKARVAQIESASGSNEGRLGSYYQFEPGTWAKVARPGDVRGTKAGEDAAMNELTFQNRTALMNGLGREPTQAELYLAHQQGANGALKLMENPSRRAGDVVGDAAVNGNGGNSSMSAADFVAMWRAKFNKTQVPRQTGTGGTATGTGAPTSNVPASGLTPDDARDRPLEDKIADATARAQALAPDNPRAVEEAVRQTEAMDSRMKRAQEDTYKRDDQTISGAIFAPAQPGSAQPPPSTLGELRESQDPKVREAVERMIRDRPSEIPKFQDALNKASKGDVPETPARMIRAAGLKGLATSDPEGFAKTDIMSQDITMADKKALLDLQVKNVAKAPADPNVAAAFRQPGIANQLQTLGITPKSEDYNLLAAELGDEMKQFQTDNKRPPNAAEREEIVTRLLQDKTVAGGGWFGLTDTTEKAYKVQPPGDWMESMRKQVQTERGYVPTDMELTRAWNAAEYQKQYGGGAKKSEPGDNSAALKKAADIPTTGVPSGTPAHVPNFGPAHIGGAPSSPIGPSYGPRHQGGSPSGPILPELQD